MPIGLLWQKSFLCRFMSLQSALHPRVSRRTQKCLQNAPDKLTRVGIQSLQELHLKIIEKNADYLVINKEHDVRLDGDFVVTIEKALYRDFPSVEKFRWIHQLDYATSGILIVGVHRAGKISCLDESILNAQDVLIAFDIASTAAASLAFQNRFADKTYLAVVHGHLPVDPQIGSRVCKLRSIHSMKELYRQTKAPQYYWTPESGIKGPRPASCIFQMEQADCRRRKKNGEKVDEEFLMKTWQQIKKEPEQWHTFLDKHKKDKLRFEKEWGDHIKRIPQEDKVEYSFIRTEMHKEKDLGYFIDAPIVATPGDDFRMQISKNTSVGKSAGTIVRVLEHGTWQGSPVTKVQLDLLSGRRHQLRLHMKQIGHPIVGDATYGIDDDAPRMMLHAWKLQLDLSLGMDRNKSILNYETADPFTSLLDNDVQQ